MKPLTNKISYSIIGLESLWKNSFVNKVIMATQLLHNFQVYDIELALYSEISELELNIITEFFQDIKSNITSIHLPKNMSLNTVTVEQLKSLLNFATTNKCNMLVIHSDQKEVNLSNAYRLYNDLCKIAPNIKLLLENTANITNLFKAVEELRHIESFGITVDLEHMCLRDENIQVYENIADVICNIHFRDFLESNRYVLPGKGVLNYSEVYSFIYRLYKDTITVEAQFRSMKDLIYCNDFMNNFKKGILN